MFFHHRFENDALTQRVGQIHESNEKKIQEPKLIFFGSTCLEDQKYIKFKILHRGLLKKIPKIDFYVVEISVKMVLFSQNMVKIKVLC